jgi:hypothetical protein
VYDYFRFFGLDSLVIDFTSTHHVRHPEREFEDFLVVMDDSSLVEIGSNEVLQSFLIDVHRSVVDHPVLHFASPSLGAT